MVLFSQVGLFLGILFFIVAMVNGIDSLISLSDSSFLVYRNEGICVYWFVHTPLLICLICFLL